MDAARYARVRKLFLAAVELPPGEQELFLKIQSGDDVELFQEVISLLAEHDPESAKRKVKGQVQFLHQPRVQEYPDRRSVR